jgi:dephospho-CoA kinase
MVIGVTGRYCAGKNLAAGVLGKRGFVVVDVDKIGHRVLEQEKQKVIAEFGDTILDNNGAVDRRKLGKLVFAGIKNRLRLEGILHPLMKTQIKRILENKAQDYVLNAALLFRMDLHLLCDFVIVIKAPFLVRLQRALRRDGLSIPSLLQRFLAQRRIFPKLKTKGVDIYYEYNKGSAEMLAVRITAILRKRKTAEG